MEGPIDPAVERIVDLAVKTAVKAAMAGRGVFPGSDTVREFTDSLYPVEGGAADSIVHLIDESAKRYVEQDGTAPDDARNLAERFIVRHVLKAAVKAAVECINEATAENATRRSNPRIVKAIIDANKTT